jgi:TonB family protein
MKPILAICVALAALMSGASTLAAPGDVVVKPDWRRKPDGDDLARVYPDAARRAGVIGKARIECTVSVKGLLEQCEALSEGPPGWGFGAAALAMTRYFSWRPETVNGVAVGGASVVIPVDFGATSGEYGAVRVFAFDPDAAIPRLVDPVWSQTPTPAQMASAFPPEAVGKVDNGYATLRCGVRPDGLLKDCKAFAHPEEGAFKLAALTLANDFKLSVADYDRSGLGGVTVDIPISFIAPGKPRPRLTAPQWVRSLDAATLAAIFPSKAIAAGISRGGGVVGCRATHEGRLADCQVVSETPEGLGFGEAVLKAADLMAMNPWTMDGAPVDDAVIELPITLALPGAQHGPPPVSPSTHVAWTRRPSADDFALYYPAAAARQNLSGDATLQCKLKADGRLDACEVLNESPPGVGFAQAVMAMAHLFTASPTGPDGKSQAGATVVIPLRFQLPRN